MTPKWRPRPILVAEPAPMINTTPLIDLMLVLLVMLMLSIPISTHNMPIDVPSGPTPPGPPPPVHRLDVDAAGRLSWDGRWVDDSELGARLAAMAADPARPVLHFAADAETRYQRVDETLALVLRAGVTRLGFVGNQEFHRTLDRRPG